MKNKSTLHLIVGKWKTPNHSNRKAEDDSHKVKDEILKRIQRINFSKKVGDNPDIDITVEGVIILKGNGKFKNKPYFVSKIPAADYFILRLVPFLDTDEVEISILVPNREEEVKDSKYNLEIISNKLYILPNDEGLITNTIYYLMNEYFNNKINQDEYILVVIHSSKLKN